jgi:hypothetical protein
MRCHRDSRLALSGVEHLEKCLQAGANQAADLLAKEVEPTIRLELMTC